VPSSEPLAPAVEPSLEELYEDAPCGYLSLTPDGTVTRVNRTLLRALGTDAHAVVGRPLAELLAPGSRIYQATRWGPLLELQGEVREVPLDLVRADGSRLPALLNAAVRRDADGRVLGVQASLFDASDRRRYERTLIDARDRERAVRELGQHAVEGLPVTALRERAAALLRDRLRTDDIAFLEGAGPAPAGEAHDDRVIRVALGRPDQPAGAIRARRAEPFAEADRGLCHAVALVVGAAVARQRDERLAFERARRDALTGLPNRLALQEEMEVTLAAMTEADPRFALCLVDIADFRLLNDSRGYRVGDDLLCAVAERLVDHAPAGTSVGRVGDDEFLVVGPIGVGEEEMARRVAEALAAPFELDGMEHVVRSNMGTVSAGCGVVPNECLVLNAGIAMYAAKQAEREHVAYRPDLRERSQERMQTEAELRIAVREGQLRVFYQPVVSLEDRTTVSMEALVRWEHPTRGLVPPGAFIPIAEESELICDLGDFVLREATRQLAEWRAAGIVGPEVSVAVNVAARQFSRPGFTETVRAALAAAGLLERPELLGLEVTETMLVEARDGAPDVFAELSALGVGLLLDDFGTGVSSLSRLKRLPVDTLKIDRAFIIGLARSEEDEAIVAAILAMADKLGLRVVAEGADDERHVELLHELGCRRVQGFVFSRPLPADELAAFVLRSAGCAAAA
jgi:diguanylate cyclase (GGDEF)-like protein/PAS domain S-box-containing protein